MRDIRTRKDGRVGFRVHVRPSAPRSELLGWNATGELRISLAAPPVGGAANKKLIALLAEELSIARSDVRIESGAGSRVKTVSVPAGGREYLLGIPDDL
jgi:uncharacterized protein (TIGR00251 family)